jgi:hypothetical protein
MSLPLPLRRQQTAVVQRPHPLPEIEHNNPLQEAANNYNTMKGQVDMLTARNHDLEDGIERVKRDAAAQIAQTKAERDFYKQQHEDAIGALDRYVKYAASLETMMSAAANLILDGIRDSKKFAAQSLPSRGAPEEQPGDGHPSADVPQFLRSRREEHEDHREGSAINDDGE